MFKIIKKADIILFFVLLIMGISLSIFSYSSGTSGEKVEVSLDGKLYGTYDLHKDQVITINENNHLNKITIKDGYVQMSYSDCKNQICVKDGKISKTNQSIVCLPNRVMIQITGGKEEFDAVSN